MSPVQIVELLLALERLIGALVDLYRSRADEKELLQIEDLIARAHSARTREEKIAVAQGIREAFKSK